MAEEGQLRLKLVQILNHTYTEKDLEDFILALVNLLLPIIRKKSGLHFYLEDYQPRDIAMLTVSSLFVRDKQGHFPVLEKLFGQKMTEKFLGSNESDFQRYLRNILTRRLKQTFYYLSGELQPEKARIRREILYTVKKSPLYQIHRSQERLYISFSPEGPFGKSPRLLTDKQTDRLLAICLENGLGGLQVPRFFKKLADILTSHGLALEMTLKSLEEIYIETQKNYLLAEASVAENHKEKLPAWIFNQDFSLWIKELREKNSLLLSKYVKKKKIGKREKDLYLMALDELILDWQDGGQEKSLFDYLKRYLPDLTPEEYRKEKRKILEYLVKNSKNFLKSKINNWQTA